MTSFTNSPASRMELSKDYSISRVIKGGWQLSAGHTIRGQMNMNAAVDDTLAYIREGITTLDFGDIYLGVEEIIGAALKKLENERGAEARSFVQLHTKYVPDIQSLSSLVFSDTEAIIHRSKKKLGVEYLDLVQFHWWDYSVSGYIEVLHHLASLQKQGHIRHIGVTNFDVARMQEILDAGIKPLSIQLQYSLLDRRPEHGMIEFCKKNDIHLLCYGTVAGGFLSERYLDKPEPASPLENRSLIKYRLIIDEFGSWEEFQELLSLLHRIAKKHHTDISSVSSAYILTRSQVAAVIVGARDTSHLEANVDIMKIVLDEDDIRQIHDVLNLHPGPSGDVYSLERDDSRHSGIMHKNNNAK